MSEDQLKAFIAAVQDDPNLQEKLRSANDSNAVVAIAADAGFTVSSDDLKRAAQEISDTELEGASGGLDARSAYVGWPFC